MPKKYDNEEFRKIVFSKKSWISDICEEYSSSNEEIQVLCQKGHKSKVPTKALTRDDKLKECPICKKTPNKCLLCGKELDSKSKKFCNSSCAAIFNNKKRGKEKIEKRKYSREKNFCLFCGKEIKRRT